VHVLQRPRQAGLTDWPDTEEALALARQLLVQGA
jgi:hypothetical protein